MKLGPMLAMKDDQCGKMKKDREGALEKRWQR